MPTIFTPFDLLLTQNENRISERLWLIIRDLYDSHGRWFHCSRHLDDVLLEGSQLKWEHPESSFYALIFHDIVFEPGGSVDSEQLSCQYARSILTALDVSADIISLTEFYIAATSERLWHKFAKKTNTISNDVAQIIDCDNAIFAASPDRYDEYISDLESEYLSVSGSKKFALHRKNWLMDRLTEPKVFLSPAFANREQAARENFARELAMQRQVLGGSDVCAVAALGASSELRRVSDAMLQESSSSDAMLQEQSPVEGEEITPHG